MVTKHNPTPEERDAVLKVDMDPAEFIETILQTGPPQADEDETE